jgi:hypothetical protein
MNIHLSESSQLEEFDVFVFSIKRPREASREAVPLVGYSALTPPLMPGEVTIIN